MEEIPQFLKKVDARLDDRLARRSVESQDNMRSSVERISEHLDRSKEKFSVIPSAGGGSTSPAANVVIPSASTNDSERIRMVKMPLPNTQVGLRISWDSVRISGRSQNVGALMEPSHAKFLSGWNTPKQPEIESKC